jgi:putative DNA-invertase from lambdoid prophage Rac
MPMAFASPAAFFVEGGVSGSTPLADRPQGKHLLETAKAGDVIITPRLDRAFRSASDALGTLEELKADGIGLHMIDLGGDVTGNGISKLVFTILSAVAENERDRIRDRIREVKRHLASQGVYGGGERPFGYDVMDRLDLIYRRAAAICGYYTLVVRARRGAIHPALTT